MTTPTATAVYVTVDGVPHRATVRVPTIGERQVLIADPTLHRSEEALAAARRIEMYDAVVGVDGEPVDWPSAAELAQSPDAVAAVREAVAAVVAANVGRGVVADGTPVALDAAALGSWLPALSSLPDPAFRLTRPAGAAPIEFVLPSGTAGMLDWLDAGVEAAAWTRWAPVGLDPIGDRDEWTFESAGFRAILRLTCALVRLGRRPAADLTPEDVEALSLADFFFLDELYRVRYLVHPGG